MLKLDELYAVIEEKINEKKIYTDDDLEKQEELLKLYNAEQEFKRLATEGAEEAREFTRNKIYFLLNDMKEYINMDTIDSLIEQYHVNYFNNIYTNNDSDNIRKKIDEEIEEYFYKFSISKYDTFENKLFKLAQIIYQEVYGYGILDELVFESSLNEVAANRYDYIWIQYKGVKRHIPNYSFRFASRSAYENLVRDRFTSTSFDEMNSGNPYINCELRNGYRVAASCPPLSRFYAVSFRLFTYNKGGEDSRDKFFTDKIDRIISLLTKKGRRNVAVIGEMGTGKTTFTDTVIIHNLDDDLSIGLAENIHELNISRNHPRKNVLEFAYGKIFAPNEVMEMFFRFNRDIVIFGEVRTHMEAFEMIKAMLRQARGSIFTFHSATIKRMIHNLRQLLMQTGFYTDYREAQYDIADAIDLGIHIQLDRDTGKRYVYKISEILAVDENLSFIIRDLFIFDKEDGRYFINREGLHKDTIESCLLYEFNSTDVEELGRLFSIYKDEMNLYKYM